MQKLGIGVVAAILVFGVFTLAHAVPPIDSAEESQYRAVAKAYGADDWIALRWHVGTGQAWRMSQGNWKPIKDAEPLAAGRYEIHLVSSGSAEQKNWYALRINVATGKSWTADADAWRPMQVLSDE